MLDTKCQRKLRNDVCDHCLIIQVDETLEIIELSIVVDDGTAVLEASVNLSSYMDVFGIDIYGVADLPNEALMKALCHCMQRRIYMGITYNDEDHRWRVDAGYSCN